MSVPRQQPAAIAKAKAQMHRPQVQGPEGRERDPFGWWLEDWWTSESPQTKRRRLKNQKARARRKAK